MCLLEPFLLERLTPLNPCRGYIQDHGQCRDNSRIPEHPLLYMLDKGLIKPGQSAELILGKSPGCSGLSESGADALFCMVEYRLRHAVLLKL
jgi:hypothetical protein